MTSVVAEINKLKNFQYNFEKNEASLVEHVSKLGGGSGDLLQYYREHHAARESERHKLKDDIINIIRPMQKVNELIKPENINDVDLKSIKMQMLTIQNNIESLKSSNERSLNGLKEDERKMHDDLKAIAQRVQEMNRTGGGVKAKKPSGGTVARRTSSTMTSEIKVFMDFVAATGGHENGWSVEDHNLFLKYRSKAKDVNNLAKALHISLPDISEEEILEHEKWYQKYLELKERQRAALNEWRSRRLQKNNTTLTTILSPKNKKNEVWRSHSDLFDKDKRQLKMEMWKENKKLKTREKREEELQKTLKKKELEAMRRERQRVIKAEVDSWKKNRVASKEAERAHQLAETTRERQMRASKANKMIKQFQSQDELIIQKKMQQKFGSKSEFEITKVGPTAPSDPERLFRPTKQWILRKFGPDDVDTFQNTLTVHNIPKLATPSWRRHFM